MAYSRPRKRRKNHPCLRLTSKASIHANTHTEKISTHQNHFHSNLCAQFWNCYELRCQKILTSIQLMLLTQLLLLFKRCLAVRFHYIVDFKKKQRIFFAYGKHAYTWNSRLFDEIQKRTMRLMKSMVRELGHVDCWLCYIKCSEDIPFNVS